MVLVLLVRRCSYLLIGSPCAIGPQPRGVPTKPHCPREVDEMVTRLAARLEAQPDDARGWALLARSHYAMSTSRRRSPLSPGRQIDNDDAALYADYADALAMSRGRRFDNEVMSLVARALEIDPDHAKALLIAGTAAFARNDYRGAVIHLQRLQQRLPADSRHLAAGAREARVEAHALAGGERARPRRAAAGATFQGRVELSAALAGRAAPTDTVFILARAPEGSRMPLAILKRQVRDLPVDFTLSDEQAMSPEMKLLSFPEVVIVARVSKSGTAAPQGGDLGAPPPSSSSAPRGSRCRSTQWCPDKDLCTTGRGPGGVRGRGALGVMPRVQSRRARQMP